MRRDGTYHHENLGLKRISYACQFTIPDATCPSHDSTCNHTDTRSPQPNEERCTADSPYPLGFSTSFSSLSPMSLVGIHNSTIIVEHKVKSSPSISQCNDNALTLSKAYTEYSIHPRLFVFPSFSKLRVDPCVTLQLPACLPT